MSFCQICKHPEAHFHFSYSCYYLCQGVCSFNWFVCRPLDLLDMGCKGEKKGNITLPYTAGCRVCIAVGKVTAYFVENGKSHCGETTCESRTKPWFLQCLNCFEVVWCCCYGYTVDLSDSFTKSNVQLLSNSCLKMELKNRSFQLWKSCLSSFVHSN